jgi:hypothetical protein
MAIQRCKHVRSWSNSNSIRDYLRLTLLRVSHPASTLLDEVGETAEVGEPPEGDEEAIVVSTLPVLRVSCDSRVEVLLLCGVTGAHEKAKGGDSAAVDDKLPARAG